LYEATSQQHGAGQLMPTVFVQLQALSNSILMR